MRPQHSKQLVKSLLTAGDGWKLRIANCPKREFRVSPALASLPSGLARTLRQN